MSGQCGMVVLEFFQSRLRLVEHVEVLPHFMDFEGLLSIPDETRAVC